MNLDRKIPCFSDKEENTLITIKELKAGDLVHFKHPSSHLNTIGKIMVDKEENKIVIVDVNTNDIYHDLNLITSKL